MYTEAALKERDRLRHNPGINDAIKKVRSRVQGAHGVVMRRHGAC